MLQKSLDLNVTGDTHSKMYNYLCMQKSIITVNEFIDASMMMKEVAHVLHMTQRRIRDATCQFDDY